MISSFSIRPIQIAWVLVVAGALLWVGCDSVPGPTGQGGQSPRVSGLELGIDSVRVAEGDTTAEVSMVISVRAVDPDGDIDRVVVLIEPASDPGATSAGELPHVQESLYGSQVKVSVPLQTDLFTVRVFAEDNSGLASNRVTTQFRLVVDSKNVRSSAGLRVQNGSEATFEEVSSFDRSVTLDVHRP